MAFSSLTFIYVFLPLALALWYLSPEKLRSTVLLVISVVFYALCSIRMLVLVAVYALADYLAARIAGQERFPKNTRKAFTVAAVCKNAITLVAIMVYSQMSRQPLPLGAMVYMLTSVSYIVDIYRGDEEFEPDFVNFALYGLFFGKLFEGPVVRYREIREDITNPSAKPAYIKDGIYLFIRGLSKWVLIGTPIDTIRKNLLALAASEMSVLLAWVICFITALWIYFRLSGLNDIACGLGGLFGMRLPANYNYPFGARSVTDFTDRFNITVKNFFIRYVYEPLGGDKTGFASAVLNTALVMFLWGLWFGISPNHILWGLYFSIFILLEKTAFGRLLKNAPPFFANFYTYLAVLFSMAILASGSVGQSITLASSMLGLGGIPAYTDSVAAIIDKNYVIIALAVIFSTRAAGGLMERIAQRFPTVGEIIRCAANFGLLALSTAYLVGV